MKSQPNRDKPLDCARDRKVYIGMSGGVDSSVSAVLLKYARPNNFYRLFGRPTPKGFSGFDVTGVFIKVWQPDWMECTWHEDRLDAMRVCAHLNIPFKTLDLENEYKKEVVDYMINEYKIGKTPNPDVMCNKFVKFGGFFDWAMKQGADFVATGHYVRIMEHGACNTDHKRLGSSEMLHASCSMLHVGLDSGKDQSYFLWTLTQDKLPKILFPVGGMEKSKTRKLAKKYKLPNALKRDSQGLCFIGKVDIEDFLSHYIEKKSGQVLDEKGNAIGKHEGAFFLTLGERHGFKITKKTPEDKPYYIISKDIKNNTVTVSDKSSDGSFLLEKKGVILMNTNWICEKPELNKKYTARIRHLGELFECKFKSIDDKKTEIIFIEKLVVASGQSIVVYDGNICIGGGIVL